MAHGSWIYADAVQKPVYVVRTQSDFWYELAKADDLLDPDEAPEVISDGYAYYVSFHGIKGDGSFWPDSESCESIAAGKALAESRLPSEVTWQTD